MTRHLALLLMAFMLPACATRTPASPSRLMETRSAAPVDQGNWPIRDEQGAPLIVKSGGDVIELLNCGRFGQGWLFQMHCLRRPSPATRVVIAVEDGPPNLLTFTPAKQAADAGYELFLFESFPSLHVVFNDENGVEQDLQGRRIDPMVTLLTLRVPPRQASRGSVVFLTGLAGHSSGEQDLMDRLLNRGWAVISVVPSFESLQDRTFGVNATDITPGAKTIAGAIDENLAERAYAVQAMLEYLEQARPEIAQKPSVIIGCSAGAINLPAVVARMPGRFDAAVLIAGGADLFDIVRHSDLVGSRLQILWTDHPPTALEEQQLAQQIVSLANLDPANTAACLSGMPVLLLHASLDRIVPASAGDRLYEKLGKPERWSYPLGHLLLFWWLPHESPMILDWIDRTTQSPKFGTESKN